MFKSARWRNEKKNKIKAVFKLQFHATRVAQVGGGDSLMISLVPVDVGKPTVRLEKAAIRDGCCNWENPVYETVKFSREPKTGKIHEKIYNFVLSTGSPKAGLIGEVSIDLASYAQSTKHSSLSLPLKNSQCDAVLHVSIQRMLENIDQSEAEESESAENNSKGQSLRTQLSISDADGSIKSNSAEDRPFNKRISHIVALNGNHQASSGSDVTMSSSESSSGLNTPREMGPGSNNVYQDPTSFLSSVNHNSVLQKSISDMSTTVPEEHHNSQWEWLGGSAPEASTDDSSSSPRVAISQEKPGEASDLVIEKLKTELTALSRQAEVSELELQTLRKQIVKEGKRGQDLLREVVGLKEDRDALKEECEQLKAFQKRMDKAKIKNKLQFEGGDPRALLEELRQELNYEKDLNANLRLQLQKTQESNSELILAVRDLDEMLEQKNREAANISNGAANSENAEELQETNSKYETEDDEEQKALEELVKEHGDSEEEHILEQKITDLYSELEIYRRDKDELEVQLEQLALDYEILRQENHDLSYKLEQSQIQEQLKMQYECSSSYASINELETQIENLERELERQSNEFSDSLVTITKLETHVKNLEEELEKQAEGFEADLEILTCAKVKQEQRAIRAEEALRKTRWQNANAVERLQEEFGRLSVQMASTFEANEKLATKALTEASELRLQKSYLEQLLQKAKEDLQLVQDQYEAKLCELSSQISLMDDQTQRMRSEIEDKSKQLEDGEESCGILSQEILMLRAEIERLNTENNDLFSEAEQRKTLKAELEQMDTLMKGNEMLLQRGNVERNEMENTIASLRNEAEKLMAELNVLRSLKDEKESIIGNQQLELETLKSQYNELKHAMTEDEFEKEKLRKQVFHLKSDLQKKEDAFSSLEKRLSSKEIEKLKDKMKLLEDQIKQKEAALETSTNSYLEKEKDLRNKIEELERNFEELSQKSASVYEHGVEKIAKDSEDIASHGGAHEEVKNTAENIRTTACISNENGSAMPFMGSDNEISPEREIEASVLNDRDRGNLEKLLNEMGLLRERNKSMEGELKEMQERYSEMSLKFAEVEGERQQLIMKVRNLKHAKKS